MGLALENLTAQQLERLHALLAEEVFQEETLPRVLNGDGKIPGPLWWLVHCTETFDEHWQDKKLKSPYRAFPDLPYWPRLFQRLLKEPRLYLPKSRELMLSWATVGFGVWSCQVFPRTRVIVQSEKDEKGILLIKGKGVPGYARTLYERQSPRLQAQFPLTKPMEEMPEDQISWANGSVIQSVPAGARQIASQHPSLVIFDEAAHIDEYAEALSVVEPVAPKIVSLSSVAPGAFWDTCRKPQSVTSELHGIEEWRTARGYFVRIHYSADPAKTPAWAAEKKKTWISEAMWNQEMEIDADALAGQLVFPNFKREYTVCKPFPIPAEWTRYLAIDPHPRTPHAFLWMAVSPAQEHFYYREFWPSKIYAKHGDVPEDEELWTIPEYARVVHWVQGDLDWRPGKKEKSLREQGLEFIDTFGSGGFADLQGKRERIFRTIMDPYGRAVALDRTEGKEGEETFWDRYAELGIDCEPAKKDWQSSVDVVNERLRPRRIVDETGGGERSIIRIFDTLPELILELETNRYPKLTPTQTARQDPADTPLPKRKHLTDLLRYIEITDPVFIEKRRPAEEREYRYEGIAY